MRPTIAPTTLALAALLTGCGTSPGSAAGSGTTDCQERVRFQGTTYTEVGYTDAADQQLGTARLGTCADQGKDAAGLTFPDDAPTVTVWTVDAIDPGQALARKTDNGVQVLLANGIDAKERSQLLAQLGLDG
jgi:hypothetical protein